MSSQPINFSRSIVALVVVLSTAAPAQGGPNDTAIEVVLAACAPAAKAAAPHVCVAAFDAYNRMSKANAKVVDDAYAATDAALVSSKAALTAALSISNLCSQNQAGYVSPPLRANKTVAAICDIADHALSDASYALRAASDAIVANR